MYVKNDLRDINRERREVIDEAMGELMRKVVPGTPYTAFDLSVMTGRIIPVSIFEESLARGYRALAKREEKRSVAEVDNTYLLFGYWRAGCHITRKGKRLITVKEYDEEGNLISEYVKRRGKSYYVATF